jgi:hypothetical protein
LHLATVEQRVVGLCDARRFRIETVRFGVRRAPAQAKQAIS